MILVKQISRDIIYQFSFICNSDNFVPESDILLYFFFIRDGIIEGIHYATRKEAWEVDI